MARVIGEIIENPVYSNYLINIANSKATCYKYCKKYKVSKGQFYTQIGLLVKKGFLKTKIVKEGNKKKKYYIVNFDKLISLFVDYLDEVKESRMYIVEGAKLRELDDYYAPLKKFNKSFKEKLRKSELLKGMLKLGFRNYNFVKDYYGFETIIIKNVFEELMLYLMHSGITNAKDKTVQELIDMSYLFNFNPLMNILFNLGEARARGGNPDQ
jgi:DNA-binding PadR family transcriptional regulator